ncbi:MAG: hypothetical protein AB1442_17035 [Nitrospirota bacterium]
MINKSVWTHLFFALLIVIVSIVSITLQKKPQNDLATYKGKYIALKKSYIDLARSQSNMLELLFKDYPEVRNLMPEYKDLGKSEFSEKMRYRIRELKLQANYLEREK